MEEHELPITLKKYIVFVEASKHWDYDCGEKSYSQMIRNMEASEEIIYNFRKKFKSVYPEVERMCETIIKSHSDYEASLKDVPTMASMFQVNKTVTNQKWINSACDFYQKVGEIMAEYGILDVMISRSNKSYARQGLDFMKCDKANALKEFSVSNNSKTSYSVLCLKTVFALNKIVKFIDSLEYGEMLEIDKIGAKTTNDNRIKFLSKLKTDYLKKYAEYVSSLPKEQDTYIWDEGTYSDLFGSEFDGLDGERDFEFIYKYEKLKEFIYESKSYMILSSLVSLLNLNNVKSKERDLKAWGLYKDENGDCVIGASIYGYPMSITAHLQTRYLRDVMAVINFYQNQTGYFVIPKVSKFQPVIKNDGGFMKTNLIFKPTAMQRDLIKKAYKENPDNSVIKYSYEQISSKTPQSNVEYEKLTDFID